MANTGDTGNGATLQFAANMGFGTATSAMTATVITQGAQTIGTVDVSTLATTGFMQYIPSDLADAAECTATFKWLTTVNTAVSMNCVIPGSAGTVVLTYPVRSESTNVANITGTGFITSFTPPQFANGELQMGQISWKYDGDTDPAYTGVSA